MLVRLVRVVSSEIEKWQPKVPGGYLSAFSLLTTAPETGGKASRPNFKRNSHFIPNKGGGGAGWKYNCGIQKCHHSHPSCIQIFTTSWWFWIIFVTCFDPVVALLCQGSHENWNETLGFVSISDGRGRGYLLLDCIHTGTHISCKIDMRMSVMCNFVRAKKSQVSWSETVSCKERLNCQ